MRKKSWFMQPLWFKSSAYACLRLAVPRIHHRKRCAIVDTYCTISASEDLLWEAFALILRANRVRIITFSILWKEFLGLHDHILSGSQTLSNLFRTSQTLSDPVLPYQTLSDLVRPCQTPLTFPNLLRFTQILKYFSNPHYKGPSILYVLLILIYLQLYISVLHGLHDQVIKRL